MSETGMTSEESTRLLQFIYDYEKILIDEQGQVVARFRSQTKPDSKKIIELL